MAAGVLASLHKSGNGASALLVSWSLQTLSLAAFLTCTHRQTFTRLVLNEGSTSALDYYTILSAQVEQKFQHI
jgi:hypothetical protein